MALPRIDLPQYTLNLKSDGSEIVFRPFTTGEEKVLLMAFENKDEKDILLAIKQVITNCVIKPDVFDINKLASFDLDWLFLNLRARSIGENVVQSYVCKNIVNDKECGGTVIFEFSILDVDLKVTTDHTKKIMFTDTVGVMMKYPTLAMINQYGPDMTENALSWDFLIKCVDYLFDKDNIYYASETPEEELTEFFERLTLDKFDKVDTFFQTMPHIEKTLNKNCPKCNFEHNVILEDILSFFV